MSLIMFLFGACSYMASLIFPLLGYCLACTAHYGLSGVLDLRTQQDRFSWSALGWGLLVIGVLLGPVAYGVIYRSDWSHHGGWFGGLASFHVVALIVTLGCGEDFKRTKLVENEKYRGDHRPYDYLSYT